MSLYDIIDDISAKNVVKTDTGDNRIMGVVVGIVTKNSDDNVKGRVCVQIPVRDKESNVLQWAKVAMPSSGKSWGQYFIPEVNDQVLLAFEGGSIEKPYVIGCVPRDNSKLVSNAYSQKNLKKRIVSTSGNTIELNDTENGEFIEMFTKEKEHRFKLDNKGKFILLSDKNKENFIELMTEKGVMNVKVQNKLNLEVGSVKITINGSAGSIKVEAQTLQVDAGSQIKMSASGKLALDGSATSITASGQLRLEATGVAQLNGGMVKIG